MFQLEKQLAEIDWKARYQNLINSLNIGFVLCDMEFVVIDFNQKYLEMTGYRSSQLKGRHFSELLTSSEFERLKRTVLSHRVKDQYQYESILFSASGKRTPVLNSSYINRNSAGQSESVNVLVTDIRELKEAQTKLELANQTLLRNQITLKKDKGMIETILFGIGDCVTIFDQSGKFMLGNPQGLSIRGQRQYPLLPLEPGCKKELVLEVDSQQRQFEGKIEAARDETGEIYAYVEILKDITPLMRLRQREQELYHIKREVKREALNTKMIGMSPAMSNVFELIVRCTEVDFDVLIYGETGVGKGLAVQEIHAKSSRKDKPFISVNCAALPESLLESELFGHVKGAFTGAISNRIGLFREAHGGIIFLDEIGDISKSFQAKLLRVFEEKEVRPIGCSKSYHIDVRIITATNKNLMRMADEGQFRTDLYYRLSVIPLYIPPLRERKEDILPLADYFIMKYVNPKNNKRYTISQLVQQILLDYSWPGNIRELQNAIKHALAMTRGSTISIQDLPVQILNEIRPEAVEKSKLHDFSMPPTRPEPAVVREPHRQPLSDLSRQFLETEKNAILSALLRNNGNRTRTAADLGISRTTLWRKIAMYQLDPTGAG